ncbi:MAG: M17 family metallopeptidase [Pseudomonadota bacterium]
MRQLLPNATKLIVRNDAGRPTAMQLKTADHVFLIEPKSKRQQLLERRPFDAIVRHLRSATGNAVDYATSPGTNTSPGLTYASFSPNPSMFECLSVARKLFAALAPLNPKRIAVVCNDKSDDTRQRFAEAVAAAGHAHVCALTSFKRQKPAARRLRYLDVYVCPSLDTHRLKAEANGNNIARVLAALPPNVLNAANYIDACRELAKKDNLAITVYDQAQLKRMGANAFLAVAQGNPHGSAGIVCLRRAGADTRPWVSLVGKGVCFDTGGINVKSAAGMQGMHEDMQGSSVALGSFLALCAIEPDRTLECWLAITENRIDGEAHTPTEVITAANGTTIEVMHSDAEGRMALCDTLHFASAQKPELLIDFATLTGACVNALTERYSGAFANREALNATLIAAGESSGERTWPFPMASDYDELLDSKYADVVQCPISGKGDHIAAARFLNRFIARGVPWVHVDLSAGNKKGGLAHVGTDTTGFGVRFTTHFLIEQQAHAVLNGKA